MPTRSGINYTPPGFTHTIPATNDPMFKKLLITYSSEAPNSNTQRSETLLKLLVKRKTELYLAQNYINYAFKNISVAKKELIKKALINYKYNLSKTAFNIIKNHVNSANESQFNNYISSRLTNRSFNNLLRELLPNKK